MSIQTDNILNGVEDKLHRLVMTGNEYAIEEIRKILAVCTLHYHTWEESYKLEAGQASYAYTNLSDEIRKTDEQVKWYFKLLEALVKVNA